MFAEQERFNVLKTALAMAKFPAFREGSVDSVKLQDDLGLYQFFKMVHMLLKTVKSLDQVTMGGTKIQYELFISETIYKVSNKINDQEITDICLTAMKEASPSMLDVCRRFLQTKEVTSPRRRPWLSINMELYCNLKMVDKVPQTFHFWDLVPDSIELSPVGVQIYSEEVMIRVGRCYKEDIEELQQLGNILTSCKLLVNNRDTLVGERVTSHRTKEVINGVLKVSFRKLLF